MKGECVMGILSWASGASTWRGYEYYTANKVEKIQKITESEYASVVVGTRTEPYKVSINLNHVRQSKCNCPHAEGRRIICKHMVALYFTIFPQEAENYIKEVEKYERAEEQREEERCREIRKYVYSLSKAERREALLDYMLEEHW